MSGRMRLDSLRILPASTFWQRFVGLLGRSALAPDEALLITPCSSVHTFFMRFSIDVVFLDREGVVLAVRPNVRPWRMAAARGAWACLELAEGGARRFGLRAGHSVPNLGRGSMA